MPGNRRPFTVPPGRRAVFARQALARFDAGERRLLPVVRHALDTYLAHLRDVYATRAATRNTVAHTLVAAAGDRSRKVGRGSWTPAEAAAADRAVAGFTVDDADEIADLLNSPPRWGAILDDTIMPALSDLLGPILRSAVENPGTYSAVTAWRNDWLAQRRQSLVGVPDVVAGQLRTGLRELAAQDGTNVADAHGLVSKMLADGYDSWAGRAQLIARTETVAANNQGSLASWSATAASTGATATKTWLATPDGRTRDTHAEVNGTTVGIDELFDVGSETMNGPGDPDADPGEVCNCRCTMTYEFPDGGTEDVSADDAGDTPVDEAPADGELTAAAAPSSTPVDDSVDAGPGVAIMAVVAARSTPGLSVPGASPPDPPGYHLTLAYLAEPAATFDDAARAHVEATLAGALADLVPFDADAFGQAVLNDDDSEREPALVALVQSDGAAAARGAVTSALSDVRVDIDGTFPIWLAHVTLGYNLTAQQFPADLTGTTLTFDSVVIGWGDELVPLGTVDQGGDTAPDDTVTAAVEAPVTAPPAPADATTPAPDAPAEPPAVDLTPQGLTWSGPLAILDTPSSDGRIIAGTGITFRPMPQPLNWQRASDEGHDGSTKVGRVLSVEVRGAQLWGTGDWLDPMVNFDAQQAIAEVDAGLGFVSVDLAVHAEAVADADGQLIDPSFAPGDPDDLNLVALESEFGGATLCSFAAFADARITNDPVADTDDAGQPDISMGVPMIEDIGAFAATINAAGDSVQLDDGTSIGVGDPVAGVNADGDPVVGTVASIDAAAATVTITGVLDDQGSDAPDVVVDVATVTVPATPEASDSGDAMLTAASELAPYTAANFARRELDGPTPITYDPATGAVYGHIGQWGQCHLGKLAETGKCVTVPPAPDGDYSYFELTPVHTDTGEIIMAGRLTVGTGHAGPHGGFRAALDHYDNSGTQVALAKTYEDDYGVQVAGQIIHGTPPERVEEMLRSPMSGDWRLTDPRPGSPLRLVAALGVNVPAFPVIVPRYGLSGGRQVSLVAAGVVQRVEVPDDEVRLPDGSTMTSEAFTSLVAATMTAIEARAAAERADDEITRLRMTRAKLALR